MARKAHQDGKQHCFACEQTVPTNGHGLFKQHACPVAGANVETATMMVHGWKTCPAHNRLVWTLGSYSAYPACDVATCTENAKRGGKAVSWRYNGKPKASPDRAEAEAEIAAEESAVHESEMQDGSDLPIPDDVEVPEEMKPERKVKAASKSTPIPTDAAQAFQALLATLTPKVEIDETMVRKLVSEAVDAKLSERVVTTLEVKDLDKGTKVDIDAPHPYLQRVIRLVKAGIHVYLWGPAGSGKTTAGMQVAHALKRESEIDTLDPSTFRSMVQGYMTPTGDPVHTAFSRCYTSGKVYIADECDNAPGHVQTLYNSALANGHAPLAWGNVGRADGFAFIGTGNTPGRPTREFPDRKPMSAAFADRLYFVHWPLDEASERKWAEVTGHGNAIKVPKARTITAQAWVDWVQKTREWAKSNAPTLMITPRASLVGIRALELGESPEMVAEALVFRGADAELQKKALNAVVLP